MDMETPEGDAFEQHREVVSGEDGEDEDRGQLREIPFDVNEADAAEQTRDIGYDDDDYR
jgi:hypothetical protein